MRAVCPAALAVLLVIGGPGVAAATPGVPTTQHDAPAENCRPTGSSGTPSAAPTTPNPAPDGEPPTDPDATVGDDRALNLSYQYRRLPEHPGVVEVVMTAAAVGDVGRASFRFGEATSVVEARNVTGDGPTFVWSGGGPAEFVYRLQVRWSYTGYATDAWTLLEHRGPSVDAGGARIRERIAVDGAGYVGNRTVLVGAHEVYSRAAAGGTIDLVVPDGVALLYGPERTVDALAEASRSLAIGGRDERVAAFATPEIRTEAEFLVQPGFALDGRTMLIDADAELAVWLHEYVHTRQQFPETERLAWLTEASARYYEWLLAVRLGYAEWADLRGVLSGGAGDDSVLADPETWGGESEYAKGALVLAAIDQDIRAATDGDRTLADAIRRVNGADGDLEAFVSAVRAVGGETAAATAERFVTTSDVPDPQARFDDLGETYGRAAPAFEQSTVAATASADGRTRTVDTDATRIPVARNETLRITVAVTNEGDARGVAVVAPRVAGENAVLERVDSPWIGSLAPGETATRTVAHEFANPGSYTVKTADGDLDVIVVPDRGTASVQRVNVSRSDAGADEALVTATVRNDDDRRTLARLPVTVNGTQVSTIAVVVDGQETVRATERVDLQEAGGATVGVAGVTQPADRADTEASTPGFGPAVATVALLLISVVTRRRLPD